MNLELTHVFNNESIHFLDVTLNENPGIIISLYHKPTATNTPLLALSCHLSHVTKNIPVAELVHVKWNSMNEIVQKEQLTTCTSLRQGEYPDWVLKEQSM